MFLCPGCNSEVPKGWKRCRCGHALAGGGGATPLASRFPDGRTVCICPVTGLEFVVIPEGEFEMGDLRGDGSDRECPVRRVKVKRFLMARTVVTQGMWRRVMGDNPLDGAGERFVGEDRPVAAVSWDDAQEFIGRLNGMVKEGGYRLPSEAEWEYAARSGGRRQRWPGTNREQELRDHAWYGANSGGGIHPVARKTPNGLGLYDMAGNVWEWCQDHWLRECEGAPADGTARELEFDAYRVLRGGCWRDGSGWLRSACRIGNRPEFRFIDWGFRLARSS